jgi:hypothetical protein
LFFDLPIPSNRHESEEKKEFYWLFNGLIPNLYLSTIRKSSVISSFPFRLSVPKNQWDSFPIFLYVRFREKVNQDMGRNFRPNSFASFIQSFNFPFYFSLFAKSEPLQPEIFFSQDVFRLKRWKS